MSDRLSPFLLSRDAWIRQPSHRAWLQVQGRRLLDFSKNACVEKGFAALDMDGNLSGDETPDATLTARYTHAYAMAALQGLPGCAPLVTHGVNTLRHDFRDMKHGGWMDTPDEEKGRKQAYLHAFVALAASSAALIGTEGAQELLDDAIDQIETHFWCEKEGVMRESFSADWSHEEDYRGANSNMHSTEMCMALADVTGDLKWLHRALRIVTRFVHELAPTQGYAMPEHFSRDWTLLQNYHQDQPFHSLRPFGMTPGHFVEWSHLTLKLEAALLRNGQDAPGWMLHDAKALFEKGMSSGWNADGFPGLVYTIDWGHKPHAHPRAHWAQAEAMTAAINLYKRTGNARYEQWYRTIWDYIDTTLIDRDRGSWFNEVESNGTPSEHIYQGKSDLYHAYQATLAPMLPLSPSLATAIEEMGVPY
ncbi:AGE family epimerase/isomerase [Gluconobacter wancherniae]|uniref:AGE family epimerase/isomerase n=1 Tax=Gluconobacter wancherniae TaxID=1307955 RepID=UPI001B8C5402|nr:AGE family epimerase/isomerase [Gluconobacter wancherniae]MBS1063551.1 AGE family epimerase/isomerase [Gluconobacter wancherniae]